MKYNYKEFKHGMKYSAVRNGYKINGKISIDSNGKIYLCFNEDVTPYTRLCKDKLGYKRATCLYNRINEEGYCLKSPCILTDLILSIQEAITIKENDNDILANQNNNNYVGKTIKVQRLIASIRSGERQTGSRISGRRSRTTAKLGSNCYQKRAIKG